MLNAKGGLGKRGPGRNWGERTSVSLTVDISLAQVALITAETAALARSLDPANRHLGDLAERIDRFVSARADTFEARMYATDLVGHWRRIADTPSFRDLADAHLRRRTAHPQDHVVRHMRRLDLALTASAAKPAPASRRASRRRTTAA